MAYLLAAAVSGPRLALAGMPDVFMELPLIGASELAAMRGGINLAGLDMDFGAEVRTLIDGTLALESVVSLTESGLVSRRVVSAGADIPGSIQISGDGSSPSIESVSPTNVHLPGLSKAGGVAVNDNRGFTAVLNQIDGNQFLSVIVNQANGRSISHRVRIDVTIRNFKQFQQTARSALLNARILRTAPGIR